MQKKILLTVDLEEFDLPLEYGQTIDPGRQLEISTAGLTRLMKVIDRQGINVTFFTTAFYAENNPDAVRSLANSGHEIGSHLYYHSQYDPKHLHSSKKKLEEITGKIIRGVRLPLMKKTEPALIREAGYIYDSSLNPTFIPGRYNNFFKSRKIYRDTGTELTILPVSVSPLLRFPLFWLSFKNIPDGLYKSFCRQTLRRDGYLNLYFHPWEFSDLESVQIPSYLKTISGSRLAERLDDLLDSFHDEAIFSTVTDFINEFDGVIPCR